MLYHILAVGDVVGEPGLRHLERVLRPLQKLKNISFTVVNGENASGVGLTRDQAERIRDAGADAVTLGNHAFGKAQIGDLLEDAAWLLRPANYSGRAPGHGCGLFDLGGVRIRVMNLIGRCGLAWGADNPFPLADRLLERGEADFTLVDFHAEATSEKLALGYYLDGRVSALWGTHTHAIPSLSALSSVRPVPPGCHLRGQRVQMPLPCRHSSIGGLFPVNELSGNGSCYARNSCLFPL